MPARCSNLLTLSVRTASVAYKVVRIDLSRKGSIRRIKYSETITGRQRSFPDYGTRPNPAAFLCPAPVTGGHFPVPDSMPCGPTCPKLFVLQGMASTEGNT